jgi:hypothetical protein
LSNDAVYRPDWVENGLVLPPVLGQVLGASNGREPRIEEVVDDILREGAHQDVEVARIAAFVGWDARPSASDLPTA